MRFYSYLPVGVKKDIALIDWGGRIKIKDRILPDQSFLIMCRQFLFFPEIKSSPAPMIHVF